MEHPPLRAVLTQRQLKPVVEQVLQTHHTGRYPPSQGTGYMYQTVLDIFPTAVLKYPAKLQITPLTTRGVVFFLPCETQTGTLVILERNLLLPSCTQASRIALSTLRNRSLVVHNLL